MIIGLILVLSVPFFEDEIGHCTRTVAFFNRQVEGHKLFLNVVLLLD